MYRLGHLRDLLLEILVLFDKFGFLNNSQIKTTHLCSARLEYLMDCVLQSSDSALCLNGPFLPGLVLRAAVRLTLPIRTALFLLVRQLWSFESGLIVDYGQTMRVL